MYRGILLKEHFLVFIFCLAVIAGPCTAVFLNNDLSNFHDCFTYLGLAGFDFNQYALRRYRLIIPLLAATINFVAGNFFGKMSPAHFAGNYPLSVSFFLVNSVLMAFSGLLVYRYCKAFGVGIVPALIGTLAVLTCRCTFYIAALPLVDSLFCVVVTLTLLGIKLKNTNMLLWAIFIGPFAKESFIFIAPLIFFFSHIGKRRLFFLFLLSGVLVFAYRYLYDKYFVLPVGSSMKADIDQIANLTRELPKLLSLSTLGKMIINIGLWGLAPILVLILQPGGGARMLSKLDRYLIFFLISVLLQMLLSGSMERMFYLFMPVICAIVSLSVQELQVAFNWTAGEKYKSDLSGNKKLKR